MGRAISAERLSKSNHHSMRIMWRRYPKEKQRDIWRKRNLLGFYKCPEECPQHSWDDTWGISPMNSALKMIEEKGINPYNKY